jgi:polyferredoxin
LYTIANRKQLFEFCISVMITKDKVCYLICPINLFKVIYEQKLSSPCRETNKKKKKKKKKKTKTKTKTKKQHSSNDIQ